MDQRSKYIPERLNLDRLSTDVFLLKQEGQWDKLFVRVSAKSTHFRLSQLRHQAYQAGGGRQPEQGYCIRFKYNRRNRLTRIEGNWGYSFV